MTMMLTCVRHLLVSVADKLEKPDERTIAVERVCCRQVVTLVRLVGSECTSREPQHIKALDRVCYAAVKMPETCTLQAVDETVRTPTARHLLSMKKSEVLQKPMSADVKVRCNTEYLDVIRHQSTEKVIVYAYYDLKLYVVTIATIRFVIVRQPFEQTIVVRDTFKSRRKRIEVTAKNWSSEDRVALSIVFLLVQYERVVNRETQDR